MARYARELREVELRFAANLEEAEWSLQNDGPFDCIVVCGCLSAKQSSTVPFVQKVRTEGFSGPIIAASNFPDTRDELLEAGCSHAVPNSKGDTSTLVKRVLGRQ